MIKSRQLQLIILFICIGICLLWFTSASHKRSSQWIVGAIAVESKPGLIPSVKMERSSEILSIELTNFPSFSSDLEQPEVSVAQDGKVTLSIESRSSFMGNKSEQLTDIKMRLPSSLITTNVPITFFSKDHGQTILKAVAP